MTADLTTDFITAISQALSGIDPTLGLLVAAFAGLTNLAIRFFHSEQGQHLAWFLVFSCVHGVRAAKKLALDKTFPTGWALKEVTPTEEARPPQRADETTVEPASSAPDADSNSGPDQIELIERD